MKLTQHKKSLYYRRWQNIKQRCTNQAVSNFADYGGRGISVAPEWRHDFPAFERYILDNLGECPENYTLDRIDNNGNYEPGNVRWASRFEQNINRRVPKHNTSGYRGVTWNKHDKQWSVRIGINHRRFFIANFRSKEEAAYCYDQVALQIFGNSAHTNFLHKSTQ